MPLKVSSACPECGAPTNHNEGALTFPCQYCASVLRMPDDGTPLKYIIPARLDTAQAAKAVKKALVEGKIGDVATIKKITAVYKPFWHIKGMLFFLAAGTGKTNITAKTWFHSFPANDGFVPSFASLGIQSEVLALEHYDTEKIPETAVVLPITIEKEAALEAAGKTARGVMNGEGGAFAFSDLKIIGGKLFTIYYPVLAVTCRGKTGSRTVMLDGINGNPLGEEEGDAIPTPPAPVGTAIHAPKLLTHRCPNCGHNLKTGDFDLTFHCRECRSLWLLKNNDYIRIKINAIRPPETGECAFIPFWRFTLEIYGGEGTAAIKKIGELAKIMTGGGFSLRAEDPEREIAFYVPALVSRNASGILNFAVRINIFQKQFPLYAHEEMPEGEVFGASLPEDEAREMLEPLVFAITGRIDRKMMEFYRAIRITVKKSELVLYPVRYEKDSVVDAYHDFHFAKRWLDTNVY